MEYSLTKNELNIIATEVRNNIFVPINQNKTTIFLCGADIKNKTTARARLADMLNTNPKFQLLYPEDIFDDLLAGQGQYSLLELENILADSVDCIVISPESPGSFAEIGAFSNNEKLAKKMIVISNKKYRYDKSFINYGPYRLIKKSKTGKIMNINYDDLSDLTGKAKINRSVLGHIAKIKKDCPVVKDIANLLEVENFILPCIYLIEHINIKMLFKLTKYATGQTETLSEIATKSAIGRLVHKHLISRTDNGFTITKLGAEYVRSTFNNSKLDMIRLEVINSENRRKSKIYCDNMLSADTLSE